MLDWFGIVNIRIQRPSSRNVLTALNDCDPPDTCMTATRRRKSLKLIAEVLSGSHVVIARGKVSTVRLIPVKTLGKRRFGALKDKIAIDGRFDEPLPASELQGWGES